LSETTPHLDQFRRYKSDIIPAEHLNKTFEQLCREGYSVSKVVCTPATDRFVVISYIQVPWEAIAPGAKKQVSVEAINLLMDVAKLGKVTETEIKKLDEILDRTALVGSPDFDASAEDDTKVSKLGKVILAALDSQKCSKEDFALRISADVNYVEELIEGTRTPPSKRFIQLIANALNIDIKVILQTL